MASITKNKPQWHGQIDQQEPENNLTAAEMKENREQYNFLIKKFKKE